MLESEIIDRAHVADDEFVLTRHDDEWVVRVNSRILMSSRMSASEEALAEEALARVDHPQTVLIGGLGVMRKQFGRVAGTFSLLFGLIGLGIGALLKGAAEGDSGIGLTLLLVTGVAGVVGGLIALVKPERLSIPAKDQPKLVAFAA